MLLQLLKRDKPARLVVCFDTPGPTFRHKAFADYKAQRKPIDEDLATQLSRAPELTAALGFPCALAPGYEADDVMATLARRGLDDGYEVVLVTGDKDALQMVGEGVRVYNAAKDVWLEAPQVIEKLGIPPKAVVDYLALIGDTSDNVPGVKGIGPVGAVKLLKKYGSLAGALKAAKSSDPELPAKTAAALREGEKEALTAVSLIKLDDGVPLDFKFTNGGALHPDADALKPLLARLEFNSLLKEVFPGESLPAVAVTKAPASSGEAVVPVKEVAWEELLPRLGKAPWLAVACLPPSQEDLLGEEPNLCVALPDGTAALCRGSLAKHKKILGKILEGEVLISVHDLKSCRKALENHGLALKGSSFDVKLARHLLDPSGAKPKTTGSARGQILLELAGKALGPESLKAELAAAGLLKLFEEMELPILEVLESMERAGVALEVPYLKKLAVEFEGAIKELQRALDQLAGAPINVNSPKQLGELLYDKLGLPVSHKTAKGGRSTDEEALLSLSRSHPIPAKVLEYRELSKLKSTYIDGLLERCDPKTGRVHTHFDPTGAATGRLSSLDPNLQNIPIRSEQGRKIRRAFRAPSGSVLLSADYSQIDLRVLAHVSGDARLREAFAQNEDIHTRTACEVFGVGPEGVDADKRRSAKAINFGIVYGLSAFGLAGQLGIPQKQAAEFIARYFQRYSGVAEWIRGNLEAARRDGLVRTLSGRLRLLPDLAAKNANQRAFAERAAGNTPIQGGSADVIKYAMLKIHEVLSRGKTYQARMLLQIHDELLFEVPRGELKKFAPWVKGVMEQACPLDVPLVVDLKAGENWQDMVDLNG